MEKITRNLLLFCMACLWLTACGESKQEASPPKTVSRHMDYAQIERGGKLFRQHCAVCHGVSAEGAQNWRQPAKQGVRPAPPLNGAGHAWHHPLSILRFVIKKGSPGTRGSMPAWETKLSEDEIDAIIAWFQSKWSDEIFRAWYENDQRARQ